MRCFITQVFFQLNGIALRSKFLCDTFDYKELVTSYKVSLVWYCNRIGKESRVRVVVKPKTVIPDLGKNITEGNE